MAGGGFGLLGMQERAALVGATLEIESAAGKGTTVSSCGWRTRPPATGATSNHELTAQRAAPRFFWPTITSPCGTGSGC